MKHSQATVTAIGEFADVIINDSSRFISELFLNPGGQVSLSFEKKNYFKSPVIQSLIILLT